VKHGDSWVLRPDPRRRVEGGISTVSGRYPGLRLKPIAFPSKHSGVLMDRLALTVAGAAQDLHLLWRLPVSRLTANNRFIRGTQGTNYTIKEICLGNFETNFECI
jgi:hypothetical protein